ncbi:unnamed protein product [Protopolystoma xenopodis]|uniref:Uncharacterized protein n=1 Tax=Protopolystoma xenopodis TaxID=117903 RepID=A0A3S5ACF5_9PLAT|nr:unnamed protein product [Protopolystoma xenopodis]
MEEEPQGENCVEGSLHRLIVHFNSRKRSSGQVRRNTIWPAPCLFWRQELSCRPLEENVSLSYSIWNGPDRRLPLVNQSHHISASFPLLLVSSCDWTRLHVAQVHGLICAHVGKHTCTQTEHDSERERFEGFSRHLQLREASDACDHLIRRSDYATHNTQLSLAPHQSLSLPLSLSLSLSFATSIFHVPAGAVTIRVTTAGQGN